MSDKKVYLGDAVYAHYDGYHVVLTTEDGIVVSNTIYLEPSVIEALRLFVASVRADAPPEEKPADD